MSVKNVPRKRGRPATGQDPHLTVRVPQELLDAIDAYRLEDGLSRTDVVRTAVIDYLRLRGLQV